MIARLDAPAIAWSMTIPRSAFASLTSRVLPVRRDVV
jgi:hypothetical protein